MGDDSVKDHMRDAFRFLLRWTHARSGVVIYGLATGIVAIATAARLVLEPVIGSYLFLAFLAAVVACAVLLGRGSSLYALLLGAFLAVFLFIEPSYSLTMTQADTVALFFYLTVGLVSAAAIEGLRALAHDLQAAELHQDVLAREMHHRTRNNLQLLIAATGMYHSRAKSEETKRILEAVSNRIASFGLLQELLYAPTSSGCGVEATDLVDGLRHALSTSLLLHRPITLSGSATPVRLPRSMAAAIAIAVNELVTNAVKYAFPDQRPGTIQIQLRVQPNQVLTVTVQDDGVGCPLPTPTGTGLSLISALLKPHQGRIDHEDAAPGCRATLRMPLRAQA